MRIIKAAISLLCAVSTVAGSKALRIRRNILDLPRTEVDAIFKAMMVMKTVPTREGRLKYGPKYVHYDDLVAKHLSAAANPSCDLAHLGAGFAVYHRAFTLMFEEALMSVDESIAALPYWDYNGDALDHSDPRDSIIWSDDWFGSSFGKEEDGYAIKDGFFSRNGWRVRQHADEISKYKNPFDFLRAPWNNNSSPFVTRHDLACNTVTNINTAAWELCLKAPTYLLWYACVDPTIHTMAHSFLGGIWNTSQTLPRPLCFITFAMGVPLNYNNGCISCPSNCTTDASSGASPQSSTNSTSNSTHEVEQPCTCTVSSELRCVANKLISVPTYGDFADPWSSPNDPIFFFHHANVDRHLMTWQDIHEADSANDFGQFPRVSVPCTGHGLEDVVANVSPFSNLFDGLDPTKQLTLFDVLNNTQPLYRPYSYDTLTSVDLQVEHYRRKVTLEQKSLR